MKILVTGGKGFVGSNVVAAMRQRHDVTTFGLSDKNDIRADLAVEVPSLPDKYDVVFHAAGLAHGVRGKREEAGAYFDVNVGGTANLCAALEKAGLPECLIYVSSVAVYGCEEGMDVDESHPLNGTTPYALSKIRAEQFLARWCGRHGVKLGILRAALIAGPNPPGTLGAMIDGIERRRYVSVAEGAARKSMLMVGDLPVLIDLLRDKGGIYNVCDDRHPSFRELENSISKQLGGRKIFRIPHWFAVGLAKIGDCVGRSAPVDSRKLRKITKSLTFSNEKAKRELGWQPTDVLSAFRIH